MPKMWMTMEKNMICLKQAAQKAAYTFSKYECGERKPQIACLGSFREADESKKRGREVLESPPRAALCEPPKARWRKVVGLAVTGESRDLIRIPMKK